MLIYADILSKDLLKIENMNNQTELEVLSSKKVEDFFEKTLGVPRPSRKIRDYFFKKEMTNKGCEYAPKAPLSTIQVIATEANFQKLSRLYKLAKERKFRLAMKRIWNKVCDTSHQIAPDTFK